MEDKKSKVVRDILSDITVHMKYAKYRKDLSRRETWSELVDRNKEMHIKKFPQFSEEIEWAYQYVYDRKVLPSMRSMQFAGRPLELANVRMYNCSYCPIDHWKAFPEAMLLLLSGCGFGFSVQKRHIDKLPEICRPSEKSNRRFLIGDSIEGWADAVKVLFKSYFFGGARIRFDYSDIRQKGSPLITSGGKAPGPGPLRECLTRIENLLETKKNGDRLTSLEVHDIVCHIADAIIAGGIRRAALISFFDINDLDMLTCKSGNWWETAPQRARANNSAVMVRHKLDEETFMSVLDRTEASNAGEPGVMLTNDPDVLGNPCMEISLKPNGVCNLTTINVSDLETQEEYNNRARAASIIGTLQATYTDFHYLRDEWKKTAEKESLLGVSMTGIASGKVLSLNMREAAEICVATNKEFAKKFGIRPAARVTTCKPEGTSSLVVGSASGIHAWHNDFYIRRIRINKNEALYGYLKEYYPNLLEDEFFKPHETAVISIPIKAPSGSILRTETALELLERVKLVYQEWILPGHVKGSNTHNVSVTVSVAPNEWNEVKEWMWKNRECYSGISLLPKFESDHTYKQPPFSDITEEEFEKLSEGLEEIDLSVVVEYDDNTDLQGELACAGGACTVT